MAKGKQARQAGAAAMIRAALRAAGTVEENAGHAAGASRAALPPEGGQERSSGDGEAASEGERS